MKAERPFCKTGPRWLNERLGRGCLAPLTGQDASALSAFVHCLELYARADRQGSDRAIEAMRATVRAMQPKCRHLAKATIPHVLDWADEDRLWASIDERKYSTEDALRYIESSAGGTIARGLRAGLPGGGEREAGDPLDAQLVEDIRTACLNFERRRTRGQIDGLKEWKG